MIAVLAACLLLENATVIDPRGGAPAVASLVIRDGRISTGSCEQTRDLTGKFIVPGFVDSHAHITNHAWDDQGNIRPRFDRPSIEQMLRTLLAFGVTTIRDPGSETEAAVTFRRLVADRTIIGPRIITAGRIINASNFDPEPFLPVHNADDVRREIRYQAAAGVDLIKIYSSMPPDLVKAAIDEAHAMATQPTLTPGARADLVILSKNPLDDIRNTRSIVTVIHDGIEYDPSELLDPSPGLRPPSPRAAGRGATNSLTPENDPLNSLSPAARRGAPNSLSRVSRKRVRSPSPRDSGERVAEGRVRGAR